MEQSSLILHTLINNNKTSKMDVNNVVESINFSLFSMENDDKNHHHDDDLVKFTKNRFVFFYCFIFLFIFSN